VLVGGSLALHHLVLVLVHSVRLLHLELLHWLDCDVFLVLLLLHDDLHFVLLYLLYLDQKLWSEISESWRILFVN
jgi:hypothetical protein